MIMKKIMKSIFVITLALVIMLSIAVAGLSVSAAAKSLYAPTNVRIQNSGTGFTVTWKQAANATGYRVYYKTAKSDWENADTNANSISLSNLEYGNLYYIQVQTLGANNTLGNYSKPLSMTHVRGTTLTSSVYNSNGTVTLRWNEADGANGYAIAKIQAGNKKYTYFYTADTIFIDNNVESGTVYYYQINPYYTNGKSAAYSHWSNTKSLATLYRPTVTNVNSTVANMNINWNRINGAKTYQLAYKRATDTAWNYRVTSSCYFNVSYPTQGSTYYVQVRPINGNFAGQWSEVSKHKIPTLGVPAISNTDATINRLAVNWNKVENATGYKVAFKRSTDKLWNFRTTTSTTYVVSKPTKGATYYIQVCSLYENTTSKYTPVNTQVIPLKDPYEGLTYYEAGKTINVYHPAETKLVWVVDEPAHNETITEKKEVYHFRICVYCGLVLDHVGFKQRNEHSINFHGIDLNKSSGDEPSVYKNGFVIEPVDTVLHVAEKGHHEVKLIKKPWEERVEIKKSGWYETIVHSAETAKAKIIDKAAYSYEEPINYEWKYHANCNTCGADIPFTNDDIDAHIKAHTLAHEGGAWSLIPIYEPTGIKTVNVPEQSHYVTQTIKAAWKEYKYVR